MEQPENNEIQALEDEAKNLETAVALKNAGIENSKLKQEVAKLGEILEKQRKVLDEAENSRKEAKLIFSALLALKKDNGSNLIDSSGYKPPQKSKLNEKSKSTK
ncbi:uncharacterized protein LOC108093202 [Drosophila ficusphila]|uniref:uncharacterized protein LOC108093202 n=1 Tax=Drosophila ficusphila TaxID=30025 RepID=UPI0007E5C1D8|nr:uncharacterized protein LOC108093202 [Drosophila ficusphila]